MAKEKGSKKGSSGKAKAAKAEKPIKAGKDAKPSKASKPPKPPKPPKAPKASKVPAGRAVKAKALDLVSNPIVAEVVAATLVAAAAALRDPKKARQIAASTGDTIGSVTKSAREEGGALWKLAMDIAQRSVDALGDGDGKGAKKRGGR